MKRPLVITATATFLAAGYIAYAQAATETAFQPGAWEITHEIKGGPGKKGPRTAQYCFTESQLRADPAAPLKAQPKTSEGQKAPQCVMGAANMNGGNATLTGNCKGPIGSVKANWSGTYTATSFNMSAKMKVAFMSINSTSTGRHLGACNAR